MIEDAIPRRREPDDEGQISDAQLLRRYSEQKSEAAFGELVRRRIDLVYAVARRQVGGDAQLAEDVTQRVFADLARKAATLAGRTVLSGWLYRSAQFAATDVVRAERRRRAREQENQIMTEISAESDGAVDWERLRPMLDQAMGELSEADRDAVALRFFEGRAFAEVGGALRLSEEAARKRVERALDKLHALLARRGVTSTTAALGAALANQVGMAAPAGLATSVTGSALAGAAAAGSGSATALGVLKFMSTTKTMAGVAGVIALLAVGLSVLEVGGTRKAKGELAVMRSERDDLRARLATMEKPALQPAAGVAVTTSNAPDESRPDGLKRSDVRAVRSTAWQTTSPVDHALDHPEARAAFVEQEVLRAQAKFGRFLKLAGLSAKEQDMFLKQMRDFAEAKLDLTASVRAQGYGPNNPPQDPQALQHLLKIDAQVDGEFMGKVRTLLGDERYKQFTAYRGVIPEMNVADELAGQLYETDSPLTMQQAVQLVQVLKASRFDQKSLPSPTNTLNGTFISNEVWGNALMHSNLVHGDIMMPAIDWGAPVTDAAIARSEAVLTPVQIAALKQLQAQQAARLLLAPQPPKQSDMSESGRKPTGSK